MTYDNDEVELNSAFGWKYVAKYGAFHIYRVDDIDAREMDTGSVKKYLMEKRWVQAQIGSVEPEYTL